MDWLLAYSGISPKLNYMIPFTEWIKINNCTTKFNFRKVQSPNQDKFFISMIDAERNNISFDMVMNPQGKWSIVRPVPQSIMQVKEQLINIIEKHCALKPISFFAPNNFNKIT